MFSQYYNNYKLHVVFNGGTQKPNKFVNSPNPEYLFNEKRWKLVGITHAKLSHDLPHKRAHTFKPITD